jgi:WD40 repeat protein
LVKWDAGTGSVARVLAAGLGIYINIWGLSWSPDGTQVAFSVATEHSQTVIWDVKANKAVVSLDSGNDSRLTSWSPDGKTFANVLDNVIDLYDASSWSSLASISVGTESSNAIRSLSWSPDSRRIAIQVDPKQLQVIEIPRGQVVYEKTTLDDYSIAAWSGDGKQIATVGKGGDIELWDAAKGERLQAAKTASDASTMAYFSFSPDLSMLAGMGTGFNYGCTRASIWSTTSGKVIQGFLQIATLCNPGMQWAPWLPDSSGLALQTGKSVGIFDPRTGRLLKTLPVLPDVLSPDGRFFATNYSRAIMLWEMPH